MDYTLKCNMITEVNWRRAQSTARRAAAHWGVARRSNPSATDAARVSELFTVNSG